MPTTAEQPDQSDNRGRAQLPAIHPYIARDIPWLLQEQARRLGSATFMIWESPDGQSETWTYADLLDRARRFGGGLAERGVKAGDRVLLHMGNRPEFLAAWFGCLWVGAVAVSTNINAALGELRFFAERGRCTVAITEPELLDVVQSCGASFNWIACTGAERPGTVAFEQLCVAEPMAGRDADPALYGALLYTSGTTSRPKGVVFTHANLLWAAQANAARIKITASDRAFLYLPLFHINALGYTMLATVWAGGSLLLHAKFSAQRWWDSAVRHRCTWTFAAPFIPKGESEFPAEHAFRLWGYQWGADGYIDDVLGIPCLGVYGMTETISLPIYSEIGKSCAHHAIGRAAPDYALRLVDDANQDVPSGQPGRLLVKGVRGISLFWEYLDDPETTAASFIDGWFDTGDMVTLLADGSMLFADRTKDMMKVGGENVASSEVEAVIMTVPGIREVAVVGAPHAFLDEVPVAFVAVEGPQEHIADAIRQVCERELAKFKRPREIFFRDALPRLGVGKLDRKILREELRANNGTIS